MKLKVLLSYIIVCIIWGSTYLAIKVGVGTIAPAWLAGIRYVVAGLMMLVYLFARRIELPRGWRNYIPPFIVGFLLMVMGNGMVVWSEQFITSGLAALLAGTVPIWIALITILLIKTEKVPLLMILGILLGFVGMVILVAPEIGPIRFSSIKGVLGMLVAACCWSSGTIYTSRLGKRYDPFVMTTLEMLFGGAVLLVIAVLFQPFHPSEVSNASWMALIYLIIFGSCLALSAYVYMMSHGPTAWASTYAYINPVIAVILGWLILQEKITWNILVGALVILIAIGIVNWEQFVLSRKESEKKEP